MPGAARRVGGGSEYPCPPVRPAGRIPRDCRPVRRPQEAPRLPGLRDRGHDPARRQPPGLPGLGEAGRRRPADLDDRRPPQGGQPPPRPARRGRRPARRRSVHLRRGPRHRRPHRPRAGSSSSTSCRASTPARATPNSTRPPSRRRRAGGRPGHARARWSAGCDGPRGVRRRWGLGESGECHASVSPWPMGRGALPGSDYPGSVTIRLYDTSARQIRDFTPLTPGCVSIYLCGATVQAAPHIGHIRSGLNFDIMRRWFEYRGYDVTFVRNVTDIDDKIIKKAAEQGRPWWSIGYENEVAFNTAYDALGCLPPDLRTARHRPHPRDDRDDARPDRARPRLRRRRQRLLRRALLPRLSAAVQPGAGQPPPAVRRGRDRQAGPARLRHVEGRQGGRAQLGDPLGPRPARLAPGVLGDGPQVPGRRLRHPRRRHRPDLPAPRERDRAGQGASATTSPRYWAHNAWVTMSGEKMSKSLGNSVLVSEMVQRWRPIVLRYYLGTPHYRSMIEYSEEALREAESAFARIEGFVQRVVEKAGESSSPPPRCRRPSPRRWTTTWASRRRWRSCTPPSGRATRALTADDKESAVARLAELRAMLGVLGLDPLDERWAGGGTDRGDDLHGVVDSLVRLVLEQRQSARVPQGLRDRRRHPRPAPAVRPRHRGHPLRPALVAVLTPGSRPVGRRADSPFPAAAGDTQSIRTYPLHVARRREQ